MQTNEYEFFSMVAVPQDTEHCETCLQPGAQWNPMLESVLCDECFNDALMHIEILRDSYREPEQ